MRGWSVWSVLCLCFCAAGPAGVLPPPQALAAPAAHGPDFCPEKKKKPPLEPGDVVCPYCGAPIEWPVKMDVCAATGLLPGPNCARKTVTLRKADVPTKVCEVCKPKDVTQDATAAELIAQGWESLDKGDLDAARQRFDAARKKDAANGEALDGLAAVAFKKSEGKVSVDVALLAQDAVRAQGAHPAAYYFLALAAVDVGQPAKAIESLQAHLKQAQPRYADEARMKLTELVNMTTGLRLLDVPEGVEIALVDAAGAEYPGEADGRARLYSKLDPNKEYSLRLKSPKYRLAASGANAVRMQAGKVVELTPQVELRKGKLTVKAAGADKPVKVVVLDADKKQVAEGAAPLEQDLPVGAYTVTGASEGRRDATQQVDVTEEAPAVCTLELPAGDATLLVVVPDALPASVILDGEEKGKAGEPITLRPGTYRVEVVSQFAGGRRYTAKFAEVAVAPGAQKRLELGALTIKGGNQADVVSVDELRLGASPLSVAVALDTPHKVSVEFADARLKRFERDVTLAADRPRAVVEAGAADENVAVQLAEDACQELLHGTSVDHGEEIKKAREAIRLDANNALAHAVLGNALLDKFPLPEASEGQSEIEKASKLAATALEKGLVCNGKGMAAMLAKKYAAARDAFKDATTYDEKLALAWANLGGAVWALQADNRRTALAEAGRCFQSAVDLDPKQGTFLTFLARIQWEKGDKRACVESLNKAKALGFRPIPPILDFFRTAGVAPN